MQDYYSNFCENIVQPILLKCQNDVLQIDDLFKNTVINFPQPKLPIENMYLEDIVNILPFISRNRKKMKVNFKYYI